MLSVMPELASNFEQSQVRAGYTERYGFVPDAHREDHVATTLMLHSHFLPSLLHRNDRMGMMASIDRLPFLDDDIVKFAQPLPPVQVAVYCAYTTGVTQLQDKAIIRHLCTDRVPDTILHKEKVGFPHVRAPVAVLDPAFFDDGYLEGRASSVLTERGKRQLLGEDNRYFAAVLGSAEVFGRLFGLVPEPG